MHACVAASLQGVARKLRALERVREALLAGVDEDVRTAQTRLEELLAREAAEAERRLQAETKRRQTELARLERERERRQREQEKEEQRRQKAEEKAQREREKAEREREKAEREREKAEEKALREQLKQVGFALRRVLPLSFLPAEEKCSKRAVSRCLHTDVLPRSNGRRR